MIGEWREVSTLAELNQFLKEVGVFHDGILKEVHWVNRDHVDQSLSMHPYQLADARVLVQRQRQNPSAVELNLEKVWFLALDTVDFVVDSEARQELSNAQLGPPKELLALQIGDSKIAFERMRWRDVSDWMGPGRRFGPLANDLD